MKTRAASHLTNPRPSKAARLQPHRAAKLSPPKASRPVKLPITSSAKLLTQKPKLAQLPNDVLCNVFSELHTQRQKLHGRRVENFASVCAIHSACSLFRTILDGRENTCEKVTEIDFCAPMTFESASDFPHCAPKSDALFSLPGHLDHFLQVLRLHPLMSSTLAAKIISAVPKRSPSVQTLSFNDGGQIPRKTATSLGRLANLSSVEVNYPTERLLRLLAYSFSSLESITILNVSPEKLHLVQRMIRARFFRSTSDDKEESNACAPLLKLSISIKCARKSSEYSTVEWKEMESLFDEFREFLKREATHVLKHLTYFKIASPPFQFRMQNLLEVLRRKANAGYLFTYRQTLVEVCLDTGASVLSTKIGESSHTRVHSPIKGLIGEASLSRRETIAKSMLVNVRELCFGSRYWAQRFGDMYEQGGQKKDFFIDMLREHAKNVTTVCVPFEVGQLSNGTGTCQNTLRLLTCLLTILPNVQMLKIPSDIVVFLTKHYRLLKNSRDVDSSKNEENSNLVAHFFMACKKIRWMHFNGRRGTNIAAKAMENVMCSFPKFLALLPKHCKQLEALTIGKSEEVRGTKKGLNKSVFDRALQEIDCLESRCDGVCGRSLYKQFQTWREQIAKV